MPDATIDKATERFLDAAAEGGAQVDDTTQTDEGGGDETQTQAATADKSGLIAVPDKNGKVKMMTQEELVAQYQQARERGNIANSERQEKAQLKKDVNYYKQMETDLEIAAQPTHPDFENAMRRLPTYKALKVSANDIEETIKAVKKGGQQNTQQADDSEIPMDRLPEPVRRDYEERQQEKLDTRKANALKQMHTALDSDAVIGVILGDEDISESRVARIRKYAESVLQEKAQEAVKARTGLRLGPQLFAEIAQDVRAWMVDVGILDDDGRPTGSGATKGVQFRRTPSIGGAPYGGSTAIQTKNAPPKRPNVKDKAAYTGYLLDRLKYEAGRG